MRVRLGSLLEVAVAAVAVVPLDQATAPHHNHRDPTALHPARGSKGIGGSRRAGRRVAERRERGGERRKNEIKEENIDHLVLRG